MKKLLALLATLVLAASLAMALPPNYAGPDDPQTIPMSALISGSGSPPFIKYKWELPDDCPNEVGTQVLPVLSDDPAAKIMYGYVVATDPNGRNDLAAVYLDIFHPDAVPECGSFKFQIHNCVKMDLTSQKTAIEQAIDDAVAAGIISGPRSVHGTDAWEIMEELYNWEDAYIYKCEWPMSYHQPCGDYKVSAWAVDNSGESTPHCSEGDPNVCEPGEKLENLFEFVCVTAVELDFTCGINFGEIVPSVEKVVTGDWDMGTPLHPTLKNEGNTYARVGLRATALQGSPGAQQKNISNFDAKIYGYEWKPLGQTSVWSDQKIYFTADQEKWFDTEHVLPLCNSTKLSFSVHAPFGTPQDTYNGSMNVYIQGGFWGSCPP